jgi:hypothetical protein
MLARGRYFYWILGTAVGLGVHPLLTGDETFVNLTAFHQHPSPSPFHTRLGAQTREGTHILCLSDIRALNPVAAPPFLQA